MGSPYIEIPNGRYLVMETIEDTFCAEVWYFTGGCYLAVTDNNKHRIEEKENGSFIVGTYVTRAAMVEAFKSEYEMRNSQLFKVGQLL